MRKLPYLKSTLTGLMVFLILLNFQIPGYACTLWAAAGNSVVNGGTLIAKNRDWEPNHPQELKMVRFKNRYRFIGLYDKYSEDTSLKAGVNEFGLTVVNAAAPEIYLQHRAITMELLERILSQCKTVSEVFRHRDWFRGPRFLLLADRKTQMVVEIGPSGIFAIQTAQSGTLYHTNHYIETGFRAYNSNPVNESSLVRFNFIRKYLQSQKRFTLNDFVNISRSKINGPDNSLWRAGKTPSSTRTLASWIVWQPVSGRSVLFLRLANPHQRIKEYYFDLNQLFWDHRFFPVSKFHSWRIL